MQIDFPSIDFPLIDFSSIDFSNERDVSRETFADFMAWHELLLKWNTRINLVSKAGLEGFWLRHALDSWQLWAHKSKGAERFLDLGSGAGFPGLALAIGCKHQGFGQVTLVESTGKKAIFLRNVIRELNLPAIALSKRIEDVAPKPYDIITARAFSPLPALLAYAQPFWGSSTIGLFLKGENVVDELTEAEKHWTYTLEILPSRSYKQAVVLKITDLARVSSRVS